MFKEVTLATLIGFSSIAGYAQASDALALDDGVKEKIKNLLEGQGYRVGKIKIEDGMYEAYARKDGQKLEVFLNEDMDIVKIEED